MKKRQVAISITLAAALAAVPVLSGCSGDHYGSISFAAQDTSYAVTSQGGSAVAYGNYVYFINGTRGYDDTDGKANVWDEVVKGALYRAELNGEKYTDADGLTKFRTTLDADGMEFKYTEGTDYFDEPIKIVDVDKIAPKTIGTSSYAQGGIFIYDNYVYFASPNNQKNSVGTVQTTRTDFFMMPLGGGEPVKLYTTSEGVDTSASAYAFYKYGGSVYLVVNEGANIISVRINTAKGKTDDPVKFEVGATSVYFPVRDTYYNGISTDTPEDFIYFVRSVDEEKDKLKTGTVIEAMRPDGSEKFVVRATDGTDTIESVRDGLLFFRTQVVTSSGSVTQIMYTNLHNQLMEYSSSYASAHAQTDAAIAHISENFATEISSSITSTYAFRPDKNSNEAYLLAATDSALTLYSTDGSGRTLYSGKATPQFVQGNYLYFAGSSNDYYKVALWENMDDYKDGAKKFVATSAAAGISCDYAAGYFTYFGEVDQWASAYTYFYKADGVKIYDDETEDDKLPKGQFVGLRASSDIPTEDQIKEAKGEE